MFIDIIYIYIYIYVLPIGLIQGILFKSSRALQAALVKHAHVGHGSAPFCIRGLLRGHFGASSKYRIIH